MARARRKKPPEPWIGTKISATILGFGQPILDLLPPDAPPELHEKMVGLVILCWNAHVLARTWGQPQSLEALERSFPLLADEAPDVLQVFEVLSARRQMPRFIDDPRAVGEWHIRRPAPGEWALRCDARMPPGAPTAKAGA